jgi:hypothetical protein
MRVVSKAWEIQDTHGVTRKSLYVVLNRISIYEMG